MAQRFEEQVQLRFASPRTGAAEGLMGLSQKLARIRDQKLAEQKQRVIEEQTLAGQQAYQKGEKPQFMDEDRLIGGVSAKAYNKGLRAAYIVGAKNDAITNINQIEMDSGDDLAKFDSAMAANIQGVMESVDPTAAPEIQAFLDSRASMARERVQKLEFDSNRRVAVAETTKGITDMVDEAAKQARFGDLVASGQTLLAAFEAIDSAVEANIVDESEAANMKRTAELRATQENILGTVRGFVDRGESSKALQTIEAMRSQPIKGMTLEEQNNMATAVIADINQTLTIKTKREAIEDDAAGDAQDEFSQGLYADIITGAANGNDVIRAIESRQINETQGRTLINVINTQGAGVDDYSLISEIEIMIDNNESATAIHKVISENTGTRLTQSRALTLLGSVNDAVAKGSPMQAETYKSAKSYLEGMVAVRGPLGNLDTESERRLADMNRTLRERVLEGEDPWMVVDELIPRDEFNRAAAPQFGSKDNLEGAMQALNEQMAAGLIDDDTYNFEAAKIDNLIRLRDTIIAFDKAKKERINAAR